MWLNVTWHLWCPWWFGSPCAHSPRWLKHATSGPLHIQCPLLGRLCLQLSMTCSLSSFQSWLKSSQTTGLILQYLPRPQSRIFSWPALFLFYSYHWYITLICLLSTPQCNTSFMRTGNFLLSGFFYYSISRAYHSSWHIAGNPLSWLNEFYFENLFGTFAVTMPCVLLPVTFCISYP